MYKPLPQQYTEKNNLRLSKRAKDIYLKPCELYISKHPALVRTVLGSCISVAMFWRKAKIGGMSHAMLPYSVKISTDEEADKKYKFVDSSIYFMHKQFKAWGAELYDIDVKVFGGSEMFSSGVMSNGLKRESVGSKNIETAFSVLKNLGYKITAQDVGGTCGRKMYFDTYTGKVYIKNINVA
jgi:chemotaxis protein CheD